MEQGQVGDCWLLASLSALAASASAPRLLARLFPTADAVAGSVTVSLYAHGAWTDVTVDTLVPCDAECQPLFARGSAAAALVEKAYAKLRGSYAALDEGRASEACVDLTGGVAERVSVEEHGAALYARMMRWQHAGRPMTATRLPHLRPAGAAAPSVGDDYRAEPHHAYAVAAVGGGGGHGGHAVLLRDPRGRDEWVAFATFAASFEVVTVCTVFDGPPLLVADVGVDALGGPPAAPRWACNAQWVLRAPRRATVTVALAQREGAAARRQPLTLIVVRLDGGATRAWRCDAPAIETRAGGELGVAQREVHASFVAAAGQAYAVVPSLRSPAGAAGGGALLLRVLVRRAGVRGRGDAAAAPLCGRRRVGRRRRRRRGGPLAARVVGEQPAGGGLLRGTACHRAGAARADGRAHCGALRLQRGARRRAVRRPPRRRARRP